MARSPLTVLFQKQPDPEPLPDPLSVNVPGLPSSVETRENGVLKTELSDGTVIVDFSGGASSRPKSDKFDANIAKEMEDADLDRIASDLLTGIQADDESRSEWLNMHADGIRMLGIAVEETKGSIGESAAPLEGMSKVRHPLLLEAVLLYQAMARGELLPARGPVKVRDDRPSKPIIPGIGHNGGPPLNGAAAPNPFQVPPASPSGGSPLPPTPLAQPQRPAGPPPSPHSGGPATTPPGPLPPPAPQQPAAPQEIQRDIVAQALEDDFNHYLTTIAQEYYPDTNRMQFHVGFGGQGIKKIYNCPIRRRPVSESVPIEDFIVSNALTDLGNAVRATHRSKMKQSTLRRMQLLGVYRDIPLTLPTDDEPSPVDQAKAEVVGVAVTVTDPKDADYTILECYCERDIPGYAPAQFKDKGLALPYVVTIEKNSQKVLSIRRNWRQDDKECLAKEHFVDFSYVKAFGFYGIGLLHILGQTERALTAAWREMIDMGMFANFPGFIYAKGAGRQLTNQFRVAAGSGVGLDVGLQNIRDAVMPLPYKDLGPSFVQFIQHMEELGQRLAGTANMAIGEGRQDAPVGTTLALIEQATKPIGAVLKSQHQSQAKEFQLLKERFREDPEAFWRFNRKPAMQWEKDVFLQALNDYDLTPVSDPNNPTSLHRASKAEWLKQTAVAAPGLLNPQKVFLRGAGLLDIDDAEDLLAPPAPPPQPQLPPGKAQELQLKAQDQQLEAAHKMTDAQLQLRTSQMEMRDRQAQRDAELRIAMINQDTERLRLASTIAVHADKTDAAREALNLKIGADHTSQARDHLHDVMTQQPLGVNVEGNGNV